MRQVELHYGTATDVGLVRETNEDSHLAAPPVFLVADGMGGHDGGDVASAIVVEEFGRLADRTWGPREGAEVIAETLRECQRRIADYGRQQARQGEWYAGTTVVAAMLVDGDEEPQWLVANLGDSRAYRLAGDAFGQVSVDHSLVQELVDAGQITKSDAAVHPERNVITRALGGPTAEAPDFFLLSLDEAPRLLLCSDGINGMVDDETIGGILRRVRDAREAADELVAAALAGGGRDNATAVVVDVVRVVSDEPAAASETEQPPATLELKMDASP